MNVTRAGSFIAICLGALALLSRPACGQMISIEDMATRIKNNSITGVTFITHGYQPAPPAGSGDSLLSLAESIRSATDGWLLDYDITGGVVDGDGGNAMFDLGHANVPGADDMGMSKHAVVLFDWACESNETSKGWGEAAGDALFALSVQLGFATPKQKTGKPMHFVAHSFGSAVTSEAVERLARYEIPVDQVTYLDPHDFDQALVPVDEDQRLFELGRPPGYGATVWNNVAFADVYYQTRGHNGGAIPDFIVPNGRPISGAFNDLLDPTSDLPALNSYGNFDAAGDHGYAWSAFYQGTVQGALPAGQVAPQGVINYMNTGWGYSQFSGRNLARPAATFYGAAQSHTFSQSTLVNTATGDPNAAGLATLGLTAAQVTQGKWAPQWPVWQLANWDFAAGPSVGTLVDITPGWSHHGGGGDGDVEANAQATNHYLELNSGDAERTHNRAYIPWFATELLFAMWIVDDSSNDLLRVRIGDTTLNDYNLTTTDDFFKLYTLPIPADLRNTVTTITFEIIAGGFPVALVDSEVRIDLVQFAGLPEPGGAAMAVMAFAALFSGPAKLRGKRLGA